ncbi:peptidase M61 [Robertkochia solimangrovi]|uniref:M61 family metallopeptidase n=1 Tax=Robertkochia solimangrovi TaxID=2213046 RepID=UPI0013A5476D|nr:peptidase M61 [Robertkochia solimangrovi]
MKRIRIFIFLLCLLSVLIRCNTSRSFGNRSEAEITRVEIDLVNVVEDKVRVSIVPKGITTDSLVFYMPKIIPGTYSDASYGRMITDIKAFDRQGKLMRVNRLNDNRWYITEGRRLGKITYLVNDTFDEEPDESTFAEGSETIFSPAGTNIMAGENFFMNMSGFVGYFEALKDHPYEVTIQKPAALYGATSMVDVDESVTRDIFMTRRYPDLIDAPVLYSKPDTAHFRIEDMDVLFSIYGQDIEGINAERFSSALKTMMIAQKNYLGSINKTDRYAILAYVSTMQQEDAKGLGALEHNYSTTAVFRPNMNVSELTDVISHEFFHTLTPLNIHSEEIQYFDFNDPKMSASLWLYEGVTEYFANHFLVSEGLISEAEFYARIMEKIQFSETYDDNLSFTEMSKHVLEGKMKAEYPNVYQKGALMAMCIDIIIREKSEGNQGILDVMGELSRMYGPEKPFQDEEIISVFTDLSFPEVGVFLNRYVEQGGKIDYDYYLSKMGVTPAVVSVKQPIIFVIGQTPYLRIDMDEKIKAIAELPDDRNRFYKALGVQDQDEFLEINGGKVDGSDLNQILLLGYGIEEGDPISIKVKRQGEIVELKGKAVPNFAEGPGFQFTDSSKKELNQAWLKGIAKH